MTQQTIWQRVGKWKPRLAAVALSLAAGLCQSGCAGSERDEDLILPSVTSPGPSKSPDADASTQSQPGNVAPGEPVKLVGLATEGAKQTSYVLTGESNSVPKGSGLIVRRSPPPAKRGVTWTVPREIIVDGKPDDAQKSEMTFLLGEPDGSLRLASTVEASDDVTTEFRPPLLAVPASIKVGKGAAITEAVELIVHPRANPDKVKSQGKGSNTVTLTGKEPVTARGGTVECYKLIARLEVDMAPAKVLTITESWYAVDGSGMIAERRTERVTLAGLLIRNKRQHWVIAK